MSLNNFFGLYGAPNNLLSDQCSEFVNEVLYLRFTRKLLIH